jgi:hypothetical protein
METPIVMLLNVIFWSFGISAAILVGLIWLDDLAARGERIAAQHGRSLSGGRASVGRLPQDAASRHSANESAAKAA